MAKVRVPKEDRPPSRTGVFSAPFSPGGMEMRFRVTGKYRNPRDGEYAWGAFGEYVVTAHGWVGYDPRVILERVP